MHQPAGSFFAQNTQGFEMRESTIKYLAGLLDADGCLSLGPRRGYKDGRIRLGLMLSIRSGDATDLTGVIASLPELTGLGQIHREADRFTIWTVTHRADLEMLLPRLIKHQVIKAKHWQWVLEFWRNWRSQDKGQKSLSEAEWETLRDEYKKSRRTRVGPIKPKNHPSWCWLAGYLDGDGCFSFRTSKNKNMRLSVTAHELDACGLEFLQKAFGGTIRTHSAKPHIKVWWRGLGPSNATFALNFLSKVARHARIKRYKIDQMIHWHRQRLSVSASTEEATV